MKTSRAHPGKTLADWTWLVIGIKKQLNKVGIAVSNWKAGIKMTFDDPLKDKQIEEAWVQLLKPTRNAKFVFGIHRRCTRSPVI